MTAHNCAAERKNLNIPLQLEALSLRLKASGMKLTNQRKALLEILLKQQKPVTADEIFKKIQKIESMDLVTIYRCLKKFEEADLVSRSDFGEGTSYFEVKIEVDHHHHHVICRQCNELQALHNCDLEALTKQVQKMGYQQITHRLEFFAICSACAAKSK